MLEGEVDEKYFLSDKAVQGFIAHTKRHLEKGNGFKFEPTNGEGIAKTIVTAEGSRGYCNFIINNNNPQDKIIKHGSYSPSGYNASSVVDVNSISPTVMENHGTVTAVVCNEDKYKNMPLNAYTDGTCRTIKAQYQQSSVANFIRQDGLGATGVIAIKEGGVMVKEATKQGYAIAREGDSINIAIPNSKTRRGRVGHGIANTLDTGCQQAVVVKDGVMLDTYNQTIHNDVSCTIRTNINTANLHLIAEMKIKQVGNLVQHEVGFNNPQRGRLYDPSGISPTLNCCGGGGLEPKIVNCGENIRIRKLTPREYFRLQGVDDSDIDKIQAAGISNTQQYKLAGNSITVDVLYYIFKQMFLTDNIKTGQLELF